MYRELNSSRFVGQNKNSEKKNIREDVKDSHRIVKESSNFIYTKAIFSPWELF